MSKSTLHSAAEPTSGRAITDLVHRFYSETDGHVSPAKFLSWLNKDCVYAFNTKTIVGASGTTQFVLDRRAQYRSVRHRIDRVVADDSQGAAAVEMTVEYELATGNIVVIHGSAFLTFVDRLVSRYQVYVDPHPLIAATS
ncbi:nuclear transport factor 2 family protein [Rhodococcus erythropolis]|uniref:nuclear transport factor 2 family protein n=1 Tax=Rhodococcus erythropolis TaxID=1833 RepID=UPI002227E059|nr:nuclear transport factor 2 family protein [Rhodococcus erythropolis]MCW2295374.1 hypothetical protein [Rhodococcus erythropolis]